MPRFSANISTLFQEYPLIERIGQVADAGFQGVEIQFPYGADPWQLRDELDMRGITLVLMNFPVADLMTGGQGLAAVPGREVEFAEALRLAEEYSRVLRPLSMNLLAGRPDGQFDPADCLSVFKTNVRLAHALTQKSGIQLVTEPVNTLDMPGFFLSRLEQALELIESMPDVDLKIQFDIYHMHMMSCDIMDCLPGVVDRIGHFQFSDAPGRTEPKGGIRFDDIFDLIDSLPYDGYVGAEYFPAGDTADSFQWMKRYNATVDLNE